MGGEDRGVGAGPVRFEIAAQAVEHHVSSEYTLDSAGGPDQVGADLPGVPPVEAPVEDPPHVAVEPGQVEQARDSFRQKS